MSAPKIDLHLIETALAIAAERTEAARYAARGSAYDRVRQDERAIAEAKAEMRKLSQAWSRARVLIDEADRAYDRRVLTQEIERPDGCSCHISPPCSFCVDQPDLDEAEGRA